MNSIYKNPYTETPEDLAKHINLKTLNLAVFTARSLLSAWDREHFQK
ncbi:MAG: hypothetical protein KKE17_05395 [Proteobacteria bacterium]|nr:hypothetical protein [Pseudomonadota bacterium]MBU1709425.1 hypothetical protein [Pseudomonadota bacterium]